MGTTCVNSSVCQVVAHDIQEIGHYVENPFTRKEANGFLAKFTSTRVVQKSVKNQKNCTTISVTFDFDCNKNEIWIPNQGNQSEAPKPTFLNLTETGTICDVRQINIK